VIEASGKDYFLFPHEELMPEWAENFSDILPTLASSSEATLWIEKYYGGYSVMGVEVDVRQIISPTQGVKYHENQRKWGLWGAAAWFVAAVLFYFHARKHDLNFSMAHSYRIRRNELKDSDHHASTPLPVHASDLAVKEAFETELKYWAAIAAEIHPRIASRQWTSEQKHYAFWLLIME
jgi:hypothetical protein